MSHSSILGGETAAARSAGRDTDALGPSDSSDSGSDVQGERVMPTRRDLPDEMGAVPVDLGSDSDAQGTGERGSAEGNDGAAGADILPDRIIESPEELEASGLYDDGEDVAERDEQDDLDLVEAGPAPGDRNRDVEQLEDDGDEDANGDPPEDPSDDDGPDPGNSAAGRETDRQRQVLGGSR